MLIVLVVLIVEKNLIPVDICRTFRGEAIEQMNLVEFLMSDETPRSPFLTL